MDWQQLRTTDGEDQVMMVTRKVPRIAPRIPVLNWIAAVLFWLEPAEADALGDDSAAAEPEFEDVEVWCPFIPVATVVDPSVAVSVSWEAVPVEDPVGFPLDFVPTVDPGPLALEEAGIPVEKESDPPVADDDEVVEVTTGTFFTANPATC